MRQSFFLIFTTFLFYPLLAHAQTIVLVNKESSNSQWAELRCDEIEKALQTNLFCDWAGRYYQAPISQIKIIEIYEKKENENFLRVFENTEQNTQKIEIDWILASDEEVLEIINKYHHLNNSKLDMSLYNKSMLPRSPLQRNLPKAPPLTFKSLTSVTLENKAVISFDFNRAEKKQYSLFGDNKTRYIFSFNYEYKF